MAERRALRSVFPRQRGDSSASEHPTSICFTSTRSSSRTTCRWQGSQGCPTSSRRMAATARRSCMGGIGSPKLRGCGSASGAMCAAPDSSTPSLLVSSTNCGRPSGPIQSCSFRTRSRYLANPVRRQRGGPLGTRIVFLGRLAVEHKGLDTLLEGFARFMKDRSGTILSSSSRVLTFDPAVRSSRPWQAPCCRPGRSASRVPCSGWTRRNCSGQHQSSCTLPGGRECRSRCWKPSPLELRCSSHRRRT